MGFFAKTERSCSTERSGAAAPVLTNGEAIGIIVTMQSAMAFRMHKSAKRSAIMSTRMTSYVEYNESRIENGKAAEKKLVDRRMLCTGIMIGVIAAFFLFGWIMGIAG